MRICDDCILNGDAVKFFGDKKLADCDFCNKSKITHEITQQSIQYLATYIMQKYSFLDYSINSKTLFPGIISTNSFEVILSNIFNLTINSKTFVNYFVEGTGFNKCSLPADSREPDLHLFYPISHEDAVHADWLNIEDDLQANNFYNVFPRFDHFDKLNILTEIIEPGQVFYRARIGYNSEEGYCDDLERKFNFPYVKDEMLAPPPMLCTPGRLNRNGVSHLYLADDLDTAIAEIKPIPGNICSYAKIKNKNELKMIDLKRDTINSNYLTLGYNSYYFYYTISKRLSEPLEPQKQNRYLITQYLSDIIRNNKFDGIIYDSAMTFGINYLFFENGNAQIIKNSKNMVKITKVSFSHENWDDERKTYKPFVNFTDEEKNKKYAID
jgi:hypothetical protein